MGKIFVIDGTDGSGKQTQFEKLKERFDKEKIAYRTVSFPNYDSDSSALVKMYLSGEFGQHAKNISPYIASTFFAVDRYATYIKDYKEYYENGGIILADRYTTANMVHQAGKIEKDEEKDKFVEWLFDLEFGIYGLPKPTEVFLLKMPVETAIELMKDRENKFTHKEEKDIHERDLQHLQDSYKAACYVAKKYNWYTVECVKEGEIRTIDDIHQEIFKEVQKHI